MSSRGISNPQNKPSRFVRIGIGNAVNRDTLATCNVLDPGDGSSIRLALAEAEAAFNQWGVITEFCLLEGRYVFPRTQRFTTGRFNIRGVSADSVTLVCPSEATFSQNLCTVSDGSTLSDVTIEWTANGSDPNDAEAPEDIFAVYVENGGTLRNVKYVFDGSAADTMTCFVAGNFGDVDPARITIKDVSGTSETDNAFGVVYIAPSNEDGCITLQTDADVCTVENITAYHTGDPTSGTAVTLQTHANVKNVRATGLSNALVIGATYTEDATALPHFEIDGVYCNNAGITKQNPNTISFVSDVDTTVRNLRIANLSTVSDDTIAGADVDANGLHLSFNGMDAANVTVDGYAYASATKTKGFIRLTSQADSAVDRLSVLNAKTHGEIVATVSNPSTVPFTALLLDDVNVEAITIDNYATNTTIGAGSATSITVGNGALRTVIGAEMECASITNNGTGTLIAPRTHVSTAAVAATNDVTEGFRPGDYWLQTVGPVLSVCSDNTATAAVWTAV